MYKYICKRILMMIPVIIGVSLLVFLVLKMTPGDPARVVALPAPAYPTGCYRMAVKVAKKGDEGKVSGALARLIEEDPAITFVVDPETKQQIISGLGTQHLEVALAKLKNKFGVEITLETPRVPYRESIRLHKRTGAKIKFINLSGGPGPPQEADRRPRPVR